MHHESTEQRRVASLSYDLVVCETTNIELAKLLPFEV